jgi:hypothetical protein
VVEETVLAMAMSLTTATVRRTRRAVRNGPGMGMKQTMARGQGRVMQQRKGRESGREPVKGKVLLSKPQEEMISLVPWLTQTQTASWSRYILSQKHRPQSQYHQTMIATLLGWTENMTQYMTLKWICGWKLMWTHRTALI